MQAVRERARDLLGKCRSLNHLQQVLCGSRFVQEALRAGLQHVVQSSAIGILQDQEDCEQGALEAVLRMKRSPAATR